MPSVALIRALALLLTSLRMARLSAFGLVTVKVLLVPERLTALSATVLLAFLLHLKPPGEVSPYLD